MAFMNFKKKNEFEKKKNIVVKQSIAFWSPFSQGATVCSIGYAKAISEMNLNVALIELDMMHPSFKNHFDLKNSENMGLEELFNSKNFDELSVDMIKSKAVKIDKIDVFKSYFNYVDLYNLEVENASKVINIISNIYDIVIFDTNREFNNKLTDIALSMADRIIIPIKANSNDINLLNKYIELLEEHQEWSTSKCSALINMYKGDDPIYLDVQNEIDIKILGFLKMDKKIFKNKNSKNVFREISAKEVIR